MVKKSDVISFHENYFLGENANKSITDDLKFISGICTHENVKKTIDLVIENFKVKYIDIDCSTSKNSYNYEYTVGFTGKTKKSKIDGKLYFSTRSDQITIDGVEESLL